jgi:acyl-CoA thioester hydrolase
MGSKSHALVPQPADRQAIVPTNGSLYDWFEYPVRAYPHDTDYGGIVWHGTYLTWMEEARVEYLRQMGIQFADLVALGCDLPVVDLGLRYHRALRMGEAAIVKTRLVEMKGVRMKWDYQILSMDAVLLISAHVSLAAVDREKGKVMRKLPPEIESLLLRYPDPKT